MIKLLIYAILWSYSWVSLAELDQKIVDHLNKNSRSVIANPFMGFDLDPIWSDLSKNIILSSLISEPPLRINLHGDIDSRILDYFHKYKNQVIFRVGREARFNDGSPIRAIDVAMAVKRLVFFVPKHPTLSNLVGLEKWLSHEFPLMHEFPGVSISGNKIYLSFKHEEVSPFVWAAEHTAGIIPERQIDKKTGKLLSHTPLSSGRYRIKDNSYPIVRLTGKTDISVIGLNPNELHKYASFLGSNHIALADAAYFTEENYRKTLGNANIEEFVHPNNRFMLLTLDSRKPPFDKKRVRQFIAREIRKTIELDGGEPAGSLFTRVRTGFEELIDLKDLIKPFDDQEKKDILAYLIKNPMIPNLSAKDSFIYTLAKTALRLGLPAMKRNEISNIRCIFSGVDIANPVRDYLAFLTPGVSFFNFALQDSKLRALVGNIHPDNPSAKAMRNLNRYLYNESVITGIKHSHISHFVSKNTKIKKRKYWVFTVEDYFL